MQGGKTIKVSKEFAENFKKVCDHLKIPPEEIELMKADVRKDYKNAEICYAALVRDFENESLEKGLKG